MTYWKVTLLVGLFFIPLFSSANFFGQNELNEFLMKPELCDLSAVICPNEDIPNLIKQSAEKYQISEKLLSDLLWCESRHKANAVGINKDGSKDRGVAQWNSRWHPEITDDQAFNPEIAIDKTAEFISRGQIWQWSCSSLIN